MLKIGHSSLKSLSSDGDGRGHGGRYSDGVREESRRNDDCHGGICEESRGNDGQGRGRRGDD